MNLTGNRLRTWLICVVLLLPAVARAQFTFITNNGAITITGYTGPDGTVAIPDSINGLTVTSIGESAFYGLSGVTNVIMPDTITNIGFQAFTGCGLVSVVIPDNVMTIGQSAFLNCYDLTNVTIGSNVTSINDYSFGSCYGLTGVFIPKSVTNIFYSAFNFCTSLTNITVESQNSAYSSLAGVLFNQDQTELVIFPEGRGGSYAIPASVLNIRESAFNFCVGLTNVLAPAGLTNLGPDAFGGCRGLTGFVIPTNVISIGDGALSGCSLTSILVPGSVTNIGVAAFGGDPLAAITVASNNPAYCTVGGVLFDFSQTTLVEFPFGKGGTFFRPSSYVIPDGVKRIEDSAFIGCYLGNITIPPSVTSIGAFAFDRCGRLTNLFLPGNLTNIGNGAFSGTGLTNLFVPASVTTFGWLVYANIRSLYFLGSEPSLPPGIPYVLSPNPVTTVYYLPGTGNWPQYFQFNLPTAPWLPRVQSGDGQFGVRTNRFGFTINWASGQTVVVEGSPSLSTPNWQPLQTNSLPTGSMYFSDSQWTNHPERYYRLRSP